MLLLPCLHPPLCSRHGHCRWDQCRDSRSCCGSLTGSQSPSSRGSPSSQGAAGVWQQHTPSRLIPQGPMDRGSSRSQESPWSLSSHGVPISVPGHHGVAVGPAPTPPIRALPPCWSPERGSACAGCGVVVAVPAGRGQHRSPHTGPCVSPHPSAAILVHAIPVEDGGAVSAD